MADWTLGPNFPERRPRQTKAGVNRRAGKGDRWSLTDDACRNCGLDDSPHAALGLCRRCHYRLVKRPLVLERRVARQRVKPRTPRTPRKPRAS